MRKKFWYEDMVRNFINLGENMFKIMNKDFGVPIVNLLMPGLT